MDKPASNPVPLAKITAPYGVRGWVKIHLWNKHSPNLASNTDMYYCAQNGVWHAVHIEEVKPHGKGWVARIQGCHDRNETEQYLGVTLGLESTKLATLQKGEYYWHQLEGLQVWSGEHKHKADLLLLGCVDHLLETGANDVMVVMPCANSHNKKRLLIPWVMLEIVHEVNLEQGWLRVLWSEND